tara:strand:- start:276 stop:773 length:498 start_codon:yes stop_codon:yes gene_type:complete
MVIGVNDKLPNSDLVWFGSNGIERISLSNFIEFKKVVIFGVPGAFTPTCHSSHVPSFIRTVKDFNEIGVEKIICISVNDPHVLKAWGHVTGATEAGIIMLGDPETRFTRMLGMNFNAPDTGLIQRSKRYAMFVENGKVIIFNEEQSRGECITSAGEALLESIKAV